MSLGQFEKELRALSLQLDQVANGIARLHASLVRTQIATYQAGQAPTAPVILEDRDE